MRYQARRGGFTLTEMAVAAALVLLLLFLLAPTLRRNREAAHTSRNSGVAVSLQRIEAAKSLYAADNRKRSGDLVTMASLLRGGYLATAPQAPAGLTYHVGVVGEPARLEEAHETGGPVRSWKP